MTAIIFNNIPLFSILLVIKLKLVRFHDGVESNSSKFKYEWEFIWEILKNSSRFNGIFYRYFKWIQTPKKLEEG